MNRLNALCECEEPYAMGLASKGLYFKHRLMFHNIRDAIRYSAYSGDLQDYLEIMKESAENYLYGFLLKYYPQVADERFTMREGKE